MPDVSGTAHSANRIAVSAIVATLAFWAYTQTLLPGVDLGDTGGFQAAVLWPEISARQAYPLYYGLARPFVAATSSANPARGLNLFSAVWAAVAAGLLTFLCASITRSLIAGTVSGLLLAFSYTFWTQAVIAEVYSLQLALIGVCLIALYAYAARPTTNRLAAFFAVYALSFGNHMGMILLLIPFAAFLIQTTPDRRSLFNLRIIALACLVAAAGALQYAPNFMSTWASLEAPASWTDRAAAFWFDTTKQDWRSSMVLGVPSAQTGDRLGMWWFDARQQFGAAGLALAAMGMVALWRAAPAWAILAATAYFLTTAFALTYNVGDAHVFFLPGHFMTALCAGAGATLFMSRRAAAVTALLASLTYAGWRGWSTWPAVDRHADRRGEQLIARLALGVNEHTALLVSQMNWQLENVLLYTGRYARSDLAWVRLGDVMAHLPFLIEDNRRVGRDIVLNLGAAEEVIAAYGPAVPLVEDPGQPELNLSQAAAQVPKGMSYVFCLLTPPGDKPLAPEDLDRALKILTGGVTLERAASAFELIAGIAGERPQVHRSSNRPFVERFRILDEPLTARMDSWLPSDTFRRAGFGHVIRNRDHILILERGVNLVWLGRDGTPSRPYYAASLFAPEPRFRILAAAPRLARLRPQAPAPRHQ